MEFLQQVLDQDMRAQLGFTSPCWQVPVWRHNTDIHAPKITKKESKSEFWISHLSWDTEVMTKQYLTFLSWKLDSPATCAFPWFPCFGEKIIRSRRENNSLPHKSVGKKNAFHVMLRETHFLHCLHLCLGQGMVIKSWSFVKFCVPEKEPKNIFKLQNFHNIFKVLYLQLPYL